MKRDSAPIAYQGAATVSPMRFGGEDKDQDRARFVGPGQVACVCDGVTTSPHGAEAAELATFLAPALFEGDVRERLAMVCDLLMAQRRQFQGTCPSVPGDMPEAMRTMLRQVVRTKQAISYQTTMIAVRVRADKANVTVDVLRCGDSALLAFTADGELLSSSLAGSWGSAKERSCPLRTHKMRFGPGDQILVRVEGLLKGYEDLAANCGIDQRHQGNWVVCRPVDVNVRPGTNDSGTRALVIKRDDQLLVPRYLHGHRLESQGQEYRCLDYSSTIRVVPTSPPAVSADGIEHRGSATAVLPDHFYSGHFECSQDRFPPGSHFVLCSDGFYGAFATASELWGWLQENRSVFETPSEWEPKLAELHGRLQAKSGDDDMSFVWMYPITPAVPSPARIGTELEE